MLCVYGNDNVNLPTPAALMVVSKHSTSIKCMEKLTMTHVENSSHTRPDEQRYVKLNAMGL